MMQKLTLRMFYLAATGVAALAASSCSRPAKVHAEDTAPTEIPVVAVARVTSDSLSRGLVLTAEFKPYQEIDVMAKIAGYIKKINVDVGDRVRQGDLLATLEVPEMADDLSRARATLERSQSEV